MGLSLEQYSAQWLFFANYAYLLVLREEYDVITRQKCVGPTFLT
jgi:hypothetical protein